MSLKTKKKIIEIISLLNTICCFFFLGTSLVSGSIREIILAVLVIGIALAPYLYIRFTKKLKHTYWIIIPFALSGVCCIGILNFVFSVLGLIIIFISAEEEKGILEKLIKKYPILFAILVILASMTFLMSSSFFDYLSELTYGFDMLGEICAAIFLFFMIFACKKEYLIFKNKGSIRESLVVAMPYIIYIVYLGSSLLANYIVEGYSFTSIDNIIAVSLFYIAVGIFEDFLLRGLTLNILLDKYGKTKKGIWLSVFLSSLFFGLIHFSNLFTGASFVGVLIQVISATCIGMYFAAIYLRSGNVWTPALLHGFYDLAVSVSAFFVINDVVDTTAEYAEAISNYSWFSALISLFYVALAVFLLRKEKMKNVTAMVNGKELEKDNCNFIHKYAGIIFGFSVCISLSYTILVTYFEVNGLAKEQYKKILTYTDYYEEYDLTYINDYVNYNSLSDEVKILLAINNLEDNDFVDSHSIMEAEEIVYDETIFTYIDKDKITDSLKEIFGDIDNINYVSVNVSYKTSCDYDKDLLEYVCVTTNNNQSNDIKVYSNISSVRITEESDVEVYVYYLVEDTLNNVLYADSNLNTVYRYDTLVNDLTKGIEYNYADDKNRDFWKAIEESNNGMIPTYKLTFELSDMGDELYFVSSEFLTDSIADSEEVKEELISNEIYEYNSSRYSFTYNRAYFKILEENNKLMVKCDSNICLEITIISSDEWLTKYKIYGFTKINLGNYDYYNYGNEYLIYKNDFYIITINTTSTTERSELLSLIVSIEFK